MTNFKWTNASVLAFAAGDDPVLAMENRARNLVLKAMDEGWSGPPFDPLALAKYLNIETCASGDILDARMIPTADDNFLLEYNPTRPRGRLRFSIAHELAHTLFQDCGDTIRYRRGPNTGDRDNWQLEVLCNIGAAELLMPLGSFTKLSDQPPSIDQILVTRKEFDVSVEACLIRYIKLSKSACAAFCASYDEEKNSYRIDYAIPSAGWECPVKTGHSLESSAVVKEANAIGYTSKGIEDIDDKQYKIECIGLAPYPGKVVPRVVGILVPIDGSIIDKNELKEVDGDALNPRGTGAKIIAHAVPNSSATWGGRGFAASVRKKFPEVWIDYERSYDIERAPKLGEVHISKQKNFVFASMVAQRGYGSSKTPRFNYEAFVSCLKQLKDYAQESNASVHMPRVGTGHGGGNWEIIKELIKDELVDKGITTFVYTLPK